MKRFALALLALILIFSLVGCGRSYSHAEFEIELPGGYEELEAKETYDLALSDGTAVIGINRISRIAAAEVGVPDWLSPYEFADYYMHKMGVESQLEQVGYVPYFVYYHEPVGMPRQFCLAAFYRSQYAYFTVFCIVPAEYEGAYITDFVDYIDNVTFNAAE